MMKRRGPRQRDVSGRACSKDSSAETWVSTCSDMPARPRLDRGRGTDARQEAVIVLVVAAVVVVVAAVGTVGASVLGV